ncbi:hypothetical protein F5Y17DRAFT_416079 [Xylariaceae sp. FL0594]|nr:hypothetical protein F5Y17DRAFT_416079 [Xylariaceae sp. FL0594]
MRISVLLLAIASSTQATWLRWSVNRELVWAAQETGLVTNIDQTTGWTPIPTPAPGLRKDSEIVLDLLRRDTKQTNWTNSQTCGWLSGISSSALACGNDFSCVTNAQHAVACASGTLSPFFSACLDYSAFKAGSCLSLDGATGCCQEATQPACGTYIWTGSPHRYMYRCFDKPSIFTVLDVPQFVIDASIFSQTHTTPKPTTTSASGTATNAPGSGSGSGPGTHPAGGGSNSGTALPGSGSSPGDGSGSGSTTNNSSSPGSSNIPVIVGAALGGLVGLLLLLLLLWCCLRRKAKGKLGLGFTRNKKNKKVDNSSNMLHSMKIKAAAAGGRGHSSGSDSSSVMPVAQQQTQHHYYHNQEEHHYHSKGQADPLPGQQPVSVSQIVNEHSRQPSVSTSVHMTAPSNSGDGPHHVLGGVIPLGHQQDERGQSPQSRSSVPLNKGFSRPVSGYTTLNEGSTHTRRVSSSRGGHPQYVVGGIVPMGNHPNEQQPQNQQYLQPQMQPVNHFHIYYGPAPQQNGQCISSPVLSSQNTATNSTNPSVRTRGGRKSDALDEMHSQSRSHSYSRSESHSRPHSPPGQMQINIQAQAYAQSHAQSYSQSEKERRERSPSRERGRDLTRQRIYDEHDHDHRYGRGYSRGDDDGHKNKNDGDVSAVSPSTSIRRSPSPDEDFYDGEWRGTGAGAAPGGPGYRQSM